MKRLKLFFKRILKYFLDSFLAITYSKKKKYNQKIIKSIVVMCTFPLGIGDLIMNTAVIRELKHKFPKAKISLITDKNILLNNPYIDEIILVKKSFLDLIKKSRQNYYDLVLLLNKNPVQSFATLFMKRKYVLGYIYDWTVRSNFNIKHNKKFLYSDHYYDMAFNVVKNLGITKYSQLPDKLYFSNEHLKKIKKLINYNTKSKYVVINPFVLWPSRTWPINNYKELISKLINKYKIIIVGGPDELKYNKQLDIDHKNYINLTGKTDLFELSALCSLTDLFITGDAGPMHIAVSQNTKLLSFWGPTNPATRLPLQKLNKQFYALYDADAKGAGEYDMENEPIGNKSIESIKVQDALNLINRLLN